MDYASSILGLLPTGRRSIGVTQLLNKLETYLPPAQVDRIRDAYEFGAEAHQGQKRLSGEPYIAHPVAVADLLADLHLDAPTIIAAILHDVIEDTPTAKDEIAERFGADVAELVDGVSKLDHIQFRSRAEAQAESFRKMLLAMVRDIRVIMVKLADRTHNMRTLGSVPPAKRAHRRARDAGDLRADRQPPRHPLDQVRARGARLQGAVPGPPPRHREGAEARPRQPEAVRRQDRGQPARRAGEGRREGARRRPREAPLQRLSEDAPQARAARVDRRRVRLPHRRRLGRHVLPRARPGARAVPADAGALQGLHRDPAHQRLPVAAHDAVRPERHADRSADPHRRHASRRRGGHRRALAVQERRRPGQDLSRPRERVAAAPDGDAARRQLRRIHGERQARPVPRQGLRVHAARRDPAHAAQRDRRRLRVLGAHRHRQPLRRRESRSPPRAAAHAAAQRPDGRDHHRQGRDAEPGLGELRRHREGARRDPSLPEGLEALRSGRARQAAADPGARRPVGGAEESAGGAAAERRDGVQSQDARKSCSSRSAWASASRRWSRAGCCRPMPTRSRPSRRAAQPWRSRARKAWS